MVDFAVSRTRMVDNQLRTNDITDLQVLGAMGKVPRERFVADDKIALAYIDENQLVSQEPQRFLLRPHIFGRMVQLCDIQPQDVVLVVGAATGYCVAVISQLAESVVGLELDPALVAKAGDTLVSLGIDNAAVVEGNLAQGYAADAPYEVIFINGSIENLPQALTDQLKEGGRLVCVEGRGNSGIAKIYRKTQGVLSSDFAFNASAPLLPGFEAEKTFRF